MKEIVLPEEFAELYYTARETINNYERSKSMAADWQHHPDKISKVLGDRIKKGFAMKHEDYIAALQLADVAAAASRRLRRHRCHHLALREGRGAEVLGFTGEPASSSSGRC